MDLTQFVGARLVGKTLIGRATVQVLAMNAEEPLLFRIALLQAGVSSFLTRLLDQWRSRRSGVLRSNRNSQL
jgi:hypothetical protein